MSSNITNWLEYELYPALYHYIDTLIPELPFKRTHNAWIAASYLNGCVHKRSDKTVVTQTLPSCILEQGGEVVTIVDYMMRKNGTEFHPTIKALAEHAGIELPSNSISETSYRQSSDLNIFFEHCNSYFIDCLASHAASLKVKNYLIQSRSYTEETIKSMGLGYIPSQKALYEHLNQCHYQNEFIDKHLKIKQDYRIGLDYQLTIPYRSLGKIIGFKFRTISNNGPKYLNTIGLDIVNNFFNLSRFYKNDKNITIVEGELDCLHASVKGINNIVAMSGSHVSREKIGLLKSFGITSFTLCLDNEPAKTREKEQIIKRIASVIFDSGNSKIYIAELPNLNTSKTDPDLFITKEGIEPFIEVIKNATSYYQWQLQTICADYSNSQTNAKKVDLFIEQVIALYCSIADPIEKDLYLNALFNTSLIQDIGLSKKSFEDRAKIFEQFKEAESIESRLRRVLERAELLCQQGNGVGAKDFLIQELKEIDILDHAAKFEKLSIPLTLEDLKADLEKDFAGLPSGYNIDSSSGQGSIGLKLPLGALSVFAAPTSHGKTAMLINLAVNILNYDKDAEVHFFSYEECRARILKKARAVHNADEANFTNLVTSGKLNIHYVEYDSDTLISAIRYLKAKTPVKVIFIDYFQLLNLPTQKYKTYSRQEEVKRICLNLKDIAVETNLPIVLAAQFNREVIAPSRMHATRLGEAGDIERVANLLVGLWNGNFQPDSSIGEAALKKEITPPQNSIKLAILKNRDGGHGGSILGYDPKNYRIFNQK